MQLQLIKLVDRVNLTKVLHSSSMETVDLQEIKKE